MRVATLLVFIVLATYAQTNDCNNPLFGLMYPLIKTFDEPVEYKNKTCSGLWATDKTCCDLKSLQQWQKEDERLLNQSTNNFEKLVNRINTKMDDLPEKDVNLIKSKKIDFLIRLKRDRLMENYIADMNRCRNKIVKIRSSSVCSLCSGNYSSHITKGRAAVTKSDCFRLVEGCSDYFIETGYILRGIIAMFYDKSFVDLKNEKPEFEEQIEKVERFVDASSLKLLIDYLNKTKSGSPDEVVKVEICNMVFNLVKRTVFQRIAEMLDILENNFETILLILKKKSSTRLSLAIPTSISRDLQSSPSVIPRSDNLLASDSTVVIPKTDNLYTSVQGRLGTLMEIESATLKPVNLSLVFP
jgi:hypothetical protein